ncbi:Ankyrin repeats (3 copies)/Ankyrin repeats (many copies) [Lotmaria passim]
MDVVELVSILLEGNDAAIAKAVASDSFPKLCNQPLANGQYAIHALASKNCAKGVDILLKHGANVNQESEEQGYSLGFTAAHYAAANNGVSVLEVLKAHGANFNHTAADKWTPLHVATFRGQSVVMKKLVEFGADINCANKDGHTPLLFAVNLGRVKDARFLLKNKAGIQLKDAHRDNLLHYALHYRMAQQLKGQYRLPDTQLDIAVLLVLNGVRPDEANEEGELPTHYAETTLPSLPKALVLLFDNAIKLLCAPLELNYMTLVTATQQYLIETVGLEEAKAKELVGVMRALETERQGTHGKEIATLPAGHPTVPADMLNLTSGDPSHGKCPFLARAAAQQANKYKADNEDNRPHCPFSMYTIRKNKGTLLLVGIAFLVGYGCGQISC